MKITQLDMFTAVHQAREQIPLLFVRLQTDEGLVGYGEACDAYGCRAPDVVSAYIRHAFSSLVVGRDINDRAAIVTDLQRTAQQDRGRRGGLASFSLAAVEIAIWDLWSQQQGLPLWQALGGSGVPPKVYASNFTLADRTPAEHIAYLSPYFAEGMGAAKARIGEDYQQDLAVFAEVRRLLGDEVDLMVDANGRYDRTTAQRVARELEQIQVRWFEEPIVWVPSQPGMRWAEPLDTGIAISYGEHLYHYEDLAQYAASGIGSVYQPDAAICGGVQNMAMLTRSAADWGLRVVPHCAAGPIAYAANLHVATSQEAISLMEYHIKFRELWKGAVEPEGRTIFDVTDGYIRPRDAPGLGVTLTEEFIRTECRAL